MRWNPSKNRKIQNMRFVLFGEARDSSDKARHLMNFEINIKFRYTCLILVPHIVFYAAWPLRALTSENKRRDIANYTMEEASYNLYAPLEKAVIIWHNVLKKISELDKVYLQEIPKDKKKIIKVEDLGRFFLLCSNYSNWNCRNLH
jgi:hypothetical protein